MENEINQIRAYFNRIGYIVERVGPGQTLKVTELSTGKQYAFNLHLTTWRCVGLRSTGEEDVSLVDWHLRRCLYPERDVIGRYPPASSNVVRIPFNRELN